MALSSMTGFARSHGVCGSYAWAWEIKSVNGKGLDLRLRLPPGWDAIEVGVRSLRRGDSRPRLQLEPGLTVERTGAAPVVRVNAAVLNSFRRPPMLSVPCLSIKAAASLLCRAWPVP